MRARWQRVGLCGRILSLLAGSFMALSLRAAGGLADAPGAGEAKQEKPSEAMPVSLAADPKGAWFAVYAPDGLTLASTGRDGTLRLWDMPAAAGTPGQE
jgi:WD40 repeat protein